MKNSTITDTNANDKITKILAIADNKSNILPATKEIEQVEQAAQKMIENTIQENKKMQEAIKDYDSFIKQFKEDNDIVLVKNDSTKNTTKFMTPIMKIDAPTKHILDTQEDPTKTYLSLNKQMVE